MVIATYCDQGLWLFPPALRFSTLMVLVIAPLDVTRWPQQPRAAVFYQQNTTLGREASERTHPIKFLLHQEQKSFSLVFKQNSSIILLAEMGYVAIHS